MVVRLSTRFVLDPYEMENMLSSLWNLFSVVEQRIENLAGTFTAELSCNISSRC